MRTPCSVAVAFADRCAMCSAARPRRRPCATARIAGARAALRLSRGPSSEAARSRGPRAVQRLSTSPDASGRFVGIAEPRWFFSIRGSRNGSKSAPAVSTTRSPIRPRTNAGRVTGSDGLTRWASCVAMRPTHRCLANHDLRFGSSVTPASRSPRCRSLPIRSRIRWKILASDLASASLT